MTSISTRNSGNWRTFQGNTCKLLQNIPFLKTACYEPGERWFPIETEIPFIDKDELFHYDSPLSNFLASRDQSILLRQYPFKALTSVIFLEVIL